MFRKIILDNGIPLVIETTKEARSVSLGIWVRVGARHESRGKNGISHFLEHMFFKGTENRSSKDIAVEIDSMGGELNAFTSRETTTFYIKVLNEYLEKAIELLSDIFLNSVFPNEEIEKEKKVIGEEIRLVEDTPEENIHELFNKSIWGEDGLGLSVLGMEETINNFTGSDISSHIKDYYGKNNIIMACSGNFSEERLVAALNRGLGALTRHSLPAECRRPEFRGLTSIIPRDLSEAHICLGLQGIPQNSEDRYAMHLLNSILGGGVSSRLFQEIREKRGLAYSVYSFSTSYFDTGLWAVYAATGRKQVGEVITIITEQIRGISDSIGDGDLRKAKNQLKGNLLLALESTNSKMVNIAKQEIYYGRYFPPENIIESVESVTMDDVTGLCRRLVGNNRFALTVYGPVNESASFPVQP